MKGRVFSIEEFSIFDGDGIRTTVFLKGCPLRCEWCHSPEGQRYEKQLLRSPNGCLSCGKCEKIGEQLTGKKCLVEESIAACPRSLIRSSGEDYEPKELVAKILKNVDILNSSGGGITFSGGEPLMQHEFLSECLALLNGKTSRGLQTSGYASEDVFAKILKSLELVLYDLKIMDGETHRRYTGVDNAVILNNYRTLACSGVRFITRIPLIPGVTDTDGNLESTCKFLVENGVNYVELLPYNKMAGSKYKLAGMEYEPSFDQQRNVNFGDKIFEKYAITAKVL